MTPLEQILLGLIPYGPALVGDIVALFKKYPSLTPAQIASIVAATSTQADAAFESTLATIAADQQAHP